MFRKNETTPKPATEPNALPLVAAATLRRMLWGPCDFPVDPVEVAKALGLVVWQADLHPTIAGALIKCKNQDPVILLNNQDSPGRQRFVCAHALGHYIYRQELDYDTYEVVDLYGDFVQPGENKEEIFANQFAAALLIPLDQMNDLCRPGMFSQEMARHFFGADYDLTSR